MSLMPMTLVTWCFGSHLFWLVHCYSNYEFGKYLQSQLVERLLPRCPLMCQFQGGPSKQAQAQLSGLFNSITSFFHPSNHGRWLVSLSLLILDYSGEEETVNGGNCFIRQYIRNVFTIRDSSALATVCSDAIASTDLAFTKYLIS